MISRRLVLAVAVVAVVISSAGAFNFSYALIGSANGTCSPRLSCAISDGISADFMTMNCFCDAACATFGDCCIGWRPADGGISPESFRCDELKQYGNVYMVSACPASWPSDEATRWSCEKLADDDSDPMSTLPLTDEKNDVTFRNYHCAIGNGQAQSKDALARNCEAHTTRVSRNAHCINVGSTTSATATSRTTTSAVAITTTTSEETTSVPAPDVDRIVFPEETTIAPEEDAVQTTAASPIPFTTTDSSKVVPVTTTFFDEADNFSSVAGFSTCAKFQLSPGEYEVLPDGRAFVPDHTLTFSNGNFPTQDGGSLPACDVVDDSAADKFSDDMGYVTFAFACLGMVVGCLLMYVLATAVTNELFRAAVERGCLQDVHRILRRGGRFFVAVDMKGNDVTAFVLACRDRNVEVLRALLKAGADPRQTLRHPSFTFKMPTAALGACFRGDVKMLELLLDAGVSANEVVEGRTLLATAIRHRRKSTEEVVRLLLFKHQADSDIVDVLSGEAALHLAVRQNNFVVAKILLEAGASVDRESRCGMTPLFLGCLSATTGLDLIELLLQNKADPNKASGDSQLPLVVALRSPRSSERKLEMAMLLTSYGAKVDETSECGMTSVHVAYMLGLLEVAQLWQNAPELSGF